MTNRLGLSDMKSNTQFAPLALLGYRLQQRDFFAPLREQIQLPQKHLSYTPYDKLLTCLVSILSGCHAISQINTRIRPDTALARAWGFQGFAEQSTVADTLDHCTETNIQQLRAAINSIYVREGEAVHHQDHHQDLLILDVDLTGLPASKHAEWSTKGYFSGKKGGADAN
jgi:hypothetical protein